MNLDRELQLKTLEALAEIYPASASRELRKSISALFPNELSMLANLTYLEEHELIVSGYTVLPDGDYVSKPEFKLLKDGHDFLMKDGGLSAILNVVVVKFDEDFKTHLINAIQATSSTSQDKQKFVDLLKRLPADATKHLSLKLLDQVFSRIPGAVQLLYEAIR